MYNHKRKNAQICVLYLKNNIHHTNFTNINVELSFPCQTAVMSDRNIHDRCKSCKLRANYGNKLEKYQTN